jgi:putative transposase
MQRFRSTKTLQKFSAIFAAVHNHFDCERHLVSRGIYKGRRSTALVEWRAVMARSPPEIGLTAPNAGDRQLA